MPAAPHPHTSKPTLEPARALDAVLGADNLLVEPWPYVYVGGARRSGHQASDRRARCNAVRRCASKPPPGLSS
ncbi:hypothetical protein StrepF001_19985 [Streptomyces sp. F001]|nr:hypothetical protein StrepF001_19985 [Streptomyces sp. F001]